MHLILRSATTSVSTVCGIISRNIALSTTFLVKNGVNNLLMRESLGDVDAKCVGQLHQLVFQNDCPGLNLFNLHIILLFQPDEFLITCFPFLLYKIPQFFIQSCKSIYLLDIILFSLLQNSQFLRGFVELVLKLKFCALKLLLGDRFRLNCQL